MVSEETMTSSSVSIRLFVSLSCRPRACRVTVLDKSKAAESANALGDQKVFSYLEVRQRFFYQSPFQSKLSNYFVILSTPKATVRRRKLYLLVLLFIKLCILYLIFLT